MSVQLEPKKVFIGGQKGGGGKSVLACALHKETNFPIITNDFWAPQISLFNSAGNNVFMRLRPEDKVPNLPEGMPVIWDTGGYADERAAEMIRQSDCVIVPILPDPNNLKSGLQSLKQFSKHTRKIIVVINKAKSGDAERMAQLLESISGHPEFAEFPVVEFSEHKGFSNVLNHGTGLTEQSQGWSLAKHIYKKPLAQLNKLMEVIESVSSRQEVAA